MSSFPDFGAVMVAINEQTECYINLTFTDQNGNPYTPTKVDYRVDAVQQNEEVVAWTTWGGTLANSISITITAAQNAKLDASPVEMRRVTIQATASGGAQRVDKQTYALVAVPVVGTPP